METVISADVAQAAHHLQAGRVVAIPTETVYGLAANALDPHALEQIFLLKNRPLSDPLILHVKGIEGVEALGIEIPLWAHRLMSRFWPGPLTLLLPTSSLIPEIATAGLPRVAVRAPNHPLTQLLLQKLPFPLAAPSANPFGLLSPTTPQHVYAYFSGKIPFILDGGPCTVGVESTILGEENGRFIVYRPGGISRSALEEVLGEKVYIRTHSSPVPTTPGQFPRHYSPRKPLLYGWTNPPLEPTASIVRFGLSPSPHPYTRILRGSLQEIAQQLYATLHLCDQDPTEYILVERVPLEGIGEALHDRLKRASARAVFTIGHSNHPWPAFLSLLQRYEINVIIDLRKSPHSRTFPHFSQGPLQKSLYEAGISYEWQPVALRLFATLEKALQEYRHVALLCAEGEPTQCHRYRLSDELTQKEYTVFHILPEGQLQLHRAPLFLELKE